MNKDVQEYRFIRSADVYQNDQLAGRLSKLEDGAIEFKYTTDFLNSGSAPIATSLPLKTSSFYGIGGGLPAFFSGLLPEGHRLTVLKNAAKTSLADELTLLMIVGADTPGNVRIVPEAQAVSEPPVIATVKDPAELDFVALSRKLDLHSLPGVQDKISATMLTTPLTVHGTSYLLKIDPRDYPHLAINEALHLKAARLLKLPVVHTKLVRDRNDVQGLLIERFDRAHMKSQRGVVRKALEDAMQVLDLPPASKYSVSTEEACLALARHCQAPILAARNLYLQFLYAWLTGNGDLHGKNVSILAGEEGRFSVAPIYDIPCTLLYGDDTMALPVAGKTKNLKRKHWSELAQVLGLNERATRAANRLALKAASSVDLEQLPFDGSPLRGTQRELRHRRFEMDE